jgi:hypothetical protein
MWDYMSLKVCTHQVVAQDLNGLCRASLKQLVDLQGRVDVHSINPGSNWLPEASQENVVNMLRASSHTSPTCCTIAEPRTPPMKDCPAFHRKV